jgi:hypothetical protein
MRRRAAAPVLFALCLIGFGLAWVFASPPGAGPDETGHYVKATAAARGDLRGKPPRLTEVERREALSTLARGGQLSKELVRFLERSDTPTSRWAFETAREFSIPAGLANPAFGCGLAQSSVSAACLDEGHANTETRAVDSLFGTYQPFLHLVPGLGTLASDDAATALRFGRLANAMLALGLIALGALALWDLGRGALSLTGFVVAFTPSVMSFATALTPSGPEVAAGLCLAASLIRLTRTSAPRWVWAAATLGGVVLASARPLGTAFVATIVFGLAALAGPRRVRATLAAVPRRVVAIATALVVIAAAAGLWWELSYQPRAPFELGAFLEGIGPSVRELWNVTREAIGIFSALDTILPAPVYIVWLAMLALLLGTSFAVGDRHERVSLVLVAAAVLVLTVVASSVYRQTGYELQARHILPVAVVLPLYAGELLNRNRAALAPRTARRLLAGLSAIAAAVHALAFYVYCRRFAVGTDGPWMFLPDAEWSPPLDWLPWLLVAGVAALAYTAAGWQAGRALEAPPGRVHQLDSPLSGSATG